MLGFPVGLVWGVDGTVGCGRVGFCVGVCGVGRGRGVPEAVPGPRVADAEGVGAGAAGGVDDGPVVCAAAAFPPVGGAHGVGIPVGLVVDRSGTVNVGAAVGAPGPERPATPLSGPGDPDGPGSPGAGAAGPPASMVITVTASSPPPATASACRALVVRGARRRAP